MAVDWGSIAGIAGSLYSMYEQYAARHDAKRAAKKQRQQDAWDQLLSAAGGYQPGRQAPAEAPPPTNYGATVAGMGNAWSARQAGEEQQAVVNQQNQAKIDEANRSALAQEEIARTRVETRAAAKPLELHSGTAKRNDLAEQIAAAVSGRPPPERVETGSDDLERNITNMEVLKSAGQLDDTDLATLDEMKRRYKTQLGKQYSAPLSRDSVRVAAGQL